MVKVDVWSDIACPWCFVGKRKLERALSEFPHRDEVHLRFRSFELDPGAPAELDRSRPYADRLAAKYGTTPERAQAMMDRMTKVGREHGIEMRFDRLRAGSTFDAHRLLHLAAEHGRQVALKEHMLTAYFTDGALISDREFLVRLAAKVGLEEDMTRACLMSDQFVDDVRNEETLANQLGIQGVPFFVFDQRIGVSGAQPSEVLLSALNRAWNDRSARSNEEVASGPACDASTPSPHADGGC